MALQGTRVDFKLTLSNTDRGVDAQRNVVVARHPSESAEHVVLRVLAWCLLVEGADDERLEMGPGLSTPDAADLWARDLTGQLTTWVECGTADADKLRKVLLHNSGASVHAVLSDTRRRDVLLAAIAEWKKPPKGELVIWMVDPDLVTALAAREERRHSWTVTLVGGHAYIEADGVSVDGPIEPIRPLES